MRPGKYTIITNVTGTLTDHGLTLGELPPHILGKLLVTQGDKGYVVLRLNQPGTITRRPVATTKEDRPPVKVPGGSEGKILSRSQ